MDLSSAIVLSLPPETKCLLFSHVDYATEAPEARSQVNNRRKVSLVDQKLTYTLSELEATVGVVLESSVAPLTR